MVIKALVWGSMSSDVDAKEDYERVCYLEPSTLVVFLISENKSLLKSMKNEGRMKVGNGWEVKI